MFNNETTLLYYCPMCGSELHLDPPFSGEAVYFMCDDCGFTQKVNDTQMSELSMDTDTPLVDSSEESE